MPPQRAPSKPIVAKSEHETPGGALIGRILLILILGAIIGLFVRQHSKSFKELRNSMRYFGKPIAAKPLDLLITK